MHVRENIVIRTYVWYTGFNMVWGERGRGEVVAVIALTKRQARQFMLIKQGLVGDYRFKGKEGVMGFVRQAGCIQYDPLDVCGKNGDLVLQSRVEGFTKEVLYELLYEDRMLVDYFDKNLAIIDVKDWKYFERIRELNRQRGRGRAEVDAIAGEIKAIIAERGPVCSKDIGFDQKIDWYWSRAKLARAALETLYFRGDLIVHHKKGTIKYYALAKQHLPEEVLSAEDPLQDDLQHIKWRLLRRVSAVGLMWNRASDAWIYIESMKTKERTEAFAELVAERKLIECGVEGIHGPLYFVAEDQWIVDEILMNKTVQGRTELLAPLDSFLWDRKLIREIFGFYYKWEVYTPAVERRYGYYVLPILSGERFIGRTEAVNDRKNSTLVIKNVWFESDVEVTSTELDAIEDCFERFRVFHGMKEIRVEKEYRGQ